MAKVLMIFVLVILIWEESEASRIRRQLDFDENDNDNNVPPGLDECIHRCPRTAEYNPICGSNGQRYFNMGHLRCAQLCGIDVTAVRPPPCPARRSSTTVSPDIPQFFRNRI